MTKKQKLISDLTLLLPILQKKYFVASLGVFGSYVHSQQTSQSDVDLLVNFSRPVGFEFFELKDFLETKLNKRIDLVTQKALKPRLRHKILSEVIPIE